MRIVRYNADLMKHLHDNFVRFAQDNEEQIPGNQTLCDEFEDCLEMLSVQYKDALGECLGQYSPNGKGRCTENEQGYESEETRWKIRDCLTCQVQQEQLKDAERTQMDKYMKCVKDLGEKCPRDN
ncbi:hypothetical protein NPIL_460711 [Nephila pilipes]|uniref:Uncharacterized protein n=1 Tax=Nephila pilipes TaxID=299642 RepID=A0A8X6N9H0_NEPPI|nr:hypothetical protein NPIL_460711 [Nephila pilipes]